MKRKIISICIGYSVWSFLVMCIAWGTVAGPIQYFPFAEQDSLEDWAEKVLNGKVNYWLDHTEDDGFVHAESDQTCSALYKKISFNINEYPYVSWRWQAVAFPAEGRQEDEDRDYVARVYIIFPSFSFSRSRFLEYVWDETLPVGEIIDTEFDNIKRKVVQSGSLQIGQWVMEEQNILEDYIAAFGEPPKLKPRAVAMMCDSDNTESSAEALFDEIKVGYSQ